MSMSMLMCCVISKYNFFGLHCLTLSSNVFSMSLSSYCMSCSYSQFLMSSFVFVVIGALSFYMLWYVVLSITITALSGMLGSICFIVHSIKH